jgi:hypothetical protein
MCLQRDPPNFILKQDLRFSKQCEYKWRSYGLLCRVVFCLYTNVSEEHTSFIFREERLCLWIKNCTHEETCVKSNPVFPVYVFTLNDLKSRQQKIADYFYRLFLSSSILLTSLSGKWILLQEAVVQSDWLAAGNQTVVDTAIRLLCAYMKPILPHLIPVYQVRN